MKKLSVLYIVAAGILWGTSGIFVFFLTPFGFTAVQMAAVRGLVSALGIAVYLLFRAPRLFCVTKKDLRLLAGSGIGMFGTAGCYFAAISLTSVSTAVVLMYTAPIFVLIYSVLFLGERLTPKKTFSVLCMLIGCCLVSGIIGGLRFHPLGIFLGLLSGISYSAYNIFTKYQMKNNCHPLSATFYCLFFMAIIAFCAANPSEMAMHIAAAPARILPLLLALGVCTCLLPYLLYTLALRKLPVGTAAALSIVEPMAATVFSIVCFGERLTPFSAFGIVLILCAVFLLGQKEA